LSLTIVLEEAMELVVKDREINAEAVQHVAQQSTLPRTFDRLQRARDMVEWRLEASAWELSVVLRERLEQQAFLAQIDQAMRQYDEDGNDGDGDAGGEVGSDAAGNGGGSDSVPGDSDSLTVGGSVTGGDGAEDDDITSP
jgi:hypothetical protein